MRATVDDTGRIGVEADDGSWFYVTRCGRVVRDAGESRRLVREGLTADRVRRAVDNYEPRETGDAWSGGFAENH